MCNAFSYYNIRINVIRMINMDVFRKVKYLTELNGWSQYELAKKSNVPQTTVNSIFKYERVPSIPTLEGFCKAFGLTMSEFFAEGDDLHGMTAEDIQMLKKWNELNDEQKAILLKLIEQL